MNVLRLFLSLAFIGIASHGMMAADDAKPAPATGASNQEEAARKAEAAFDEAIMDFGVLAGAAYACLAEEADVRQHEARVFELANKLVQKFGTERALKFAASSRIPQVGRDFGHTERPQIAYISMD